MKWYMYRNEKGMEVKTKIEDVGYRMEIEEQGYKLINTINLKVSKKEKKAK